MNKKILISLVMVSLFLTNCGGEESVPTPQPLSTTLTPTIHFTPTPETTPTPVQVADIIFYNGQILTMTAGLPIEQAIAVKGEMILAVGSDDQILAHAGEETIIVDLEGKTLMPGFVDPHTHILNDAYRVDLDLEGAQDLALENGITTLANMYSYKEFIQDLMNLEEDGNLRVRTSVYMIGTDNCGASQGDWYKAYPPTDEFGEMLRIGGVKLFTDGGTCGLPAVSEIIYPEYGQGELAMSDEELNEVVRMADEAGYQVAIHAIGDLAVDQAIDALNVVIDSPGNPERHRIEHVSYLRDGQFSRFSEMGIHPIIFGNSPTCYIAEFGEVDLSEHFSLLFRRVRELVDANPGLIIAAKTDFPWRGEHAGPLHELYSLTTSKEISKEGGICEPPSWLSDRTITIEEALPMVTINAAYMLFREDEVGSLEPGKLADLIILSGNPLTTAPDDLINLEVWMTMVGGQVEYCMDGHEDVCP